MFDNFFFMAFGFIFLIKGADILIKGSSNIAKKFNKDFKMVHTKKK